MVEIHSCNTNSGSHKFGYLLRNTTSLGVANKSGSIRSGRINYEGSGWGSRFLQQALLGALCGELLTGLVSTFAGTGELDLIARNLAFVNKLHFVSVEVDYDFE